MIPIPGCTKPTQNLPLYKIKQKERYRQLQKKITRAENGCIGETEDLHN